MSMRNAFAVVSPKVLLTALAVALSAPAAAQSQLHYWPAASSAQDVAGGLEGTLSNGVTFEHGYLGQAFHFNDGAAGVTNALVDFGAAGDFGTSDFFVSFALKTLQTAGDMGSIAALLSKRDFCDHASFWSIRLQGGGLSIELDDGADNYTQLFSKTKALANGKWHNIVLVRTGLTTSLYVDGELDSSSVAPLGVPVNVTNGASFLAGYDACTYVDPTVPFVGAIDEIVIASK
jgi:hypothetical protein